MKTMIPGKKKGFFKLNDDSKQGASMWPRHKYKAIKIIEHMKDSMKCMLNNRKLTYYLQSFQ